MPPKHLLLTPLMLALVSTGAMAADNAYFLQLSPRLAAPGQGAPGSQAPLPTFLDADRIHGVQDRYLEAEGKVVVRRRDERLTADWMRYDQTEDRLHARGNVVVSQPLRQIVGDDLQLQLTSHIGSMRSVRYEARSVDGKYGRGEAETLLFEGKDQYRLESATYTTCPVDDDSWQVRAGELEMDRLQNLGTARNVRIEYLGTPILYAPWMDFALDGSRKSGFLMPAYGASDKRGLELITPWYWNIAPNQDATFTPRYMSQRGLQLGTEYRYLQPGYSGEIAVEFLPNDQQAGENRYWGRIQHRQQITPRLFGSLTLEHASDDAYFRDLSSQVGLTSQTNLPREGLLSYSGDGWQATGLIQRYQTLQDPAAPIVEPYHRVPQLTLNVSRSQIAGRNIDLSFTSEYVGFKHSDSGKAQGGRFHAYPSVKIPLSTSYAYVTPKLGWHLTRYDLDQNDVDATVLERTRSLPIFSLDSGLQFEREWTYAGRDFLQTLEPRLFYVYIPYRGQNDLPVFDTGLRDISLDSLFAENMFAGVDRVNDANQLTIAMTSRILEPDTGVERLQVTIGQRYYFTDQRVTLPGTVARSGDSSDILAHASGQISPNWRVSTGMQLATESGNIVRANIGAQYRAGPGKVANLDYRFNEPGDLDQIDLSWQWPIAPRWSGLGRLNYSFHDRRVVEGLAGFEYNAGCWSLRGVVHRLAVAEGEESNAFYLQLELRDLTKLGPNPLEVLQRSISGYAKSDSIDRP